MTLSKFILISSLILNVIFFSFVLYKLYVRSQEYKPPNNLENPYWKDKVSQYKILNSTHNGGVFFVGDSLFDRFSVREYFNEEGIYNRGIGWDSTHSLLMRISSTVITGLPDKVILYIGGNDIGSMVPMSASIDNIKEIVKTLSTSKIEIVVLSLLPVWKENKRSNEKIIEFNSLLKGLCNMDSCRFIDIRENFLSNTSELRRDLSNDGLHLNGEGYTELVKLIKKIN